MAEWVRVSTGAWMIDGSSPTSVKKILFVVMCYIFYHIYRAYAVSLSLITLCACLFLFVVELMFSAGLERMIDDLSQSHLCHNQWTICRKKNCDKSSKFLKTKL